MENLRKVKIIMVCFFIYSIISCKNNKFEKQNTNLETHKKASTMVDSICLKPHFFCKKINDNEGVKHIVIDNKSVASEIYDVVEDEKFVYTSLQMFVRIFSNNKEYVKVFDEVVDCHGNSKVEAIKNSIEITDLDNDGISEITFLYNLTCGNDVFPSKMKLIMIEGKSKFKIRGAKSFFNKLEDNIAFDIDNSFKFAPKMFLDFATKKWNNNIYDDRIGKIQKNKILLFNKAKEKNLIKKENWYNANRANKK